MRREEMERVMFVNAGGIFYEDDHFVGCVECHRYRESASIQNWHRMSILYRLLVVLPTASSSIHFFVLYSHFGYMARNVHALRVLYCCGSGRINQEMCGNWM